MGVETEELLLKSNVASVAAKDAAALDKLLAAADKVNDATLIGNLEKSGMLASVKAVSAELSKQAGLEAKIASFDATRAKGNADLAKSLKKLNDDATGKTAAAEEKAAAAAKIKAAKDLATETNKAAAESKKNSYTAGTDAIKDSKTFAGIKDLVGKVFGKDAGDKLGKAGEELGAAVDKMGPGGALLLKAGGGLAAGAAAIAVAAAVLTVALAAKVLMKVAELSIEESTFREGAQGALDRLTKGNGAKTYDATLKLAAKIGLDKEDAIAQTKALLQAGLSQEVIPLAIQAIADISVDLGDEKGNALKEKLAQFGHGKKIDEGAIRGLAEAGVDATKVFEALREKGESVDHVLARLKTNQVSSAEAIKAVLAAVEASSGGAASGKAKSIPGLLNAISIAATGLFDKVDTTPLKGALSNVYAVLSGPAGDKLAKATTELGTQLFKTLFGPFQGPEGQKKLEILVTRITELAGNATEALKAAAPYVASFVDILVALTGADQSKSDNGVAVLITEIADVARMAIHPLDTFWKLATKISNMGASLAGTLGLSSGAPIFDAKGATIDTAGPAASASADVGGNMSKGVAQGITDNGGSVAVALSDVVNAAVKKAEAELGIASPAKRLAVTGKWTSLGMAKGMNDNAGAVADAGTNLASMAAGGAGAGGGASGGSAGGAGAMPSISIQITIEGGKGGAADAKATAEALEPELRRVIRRVQRDIAEGGGSFKSRVA